MSAAMYLNHPYGRPIIGWRHELSALNREAALKFYKEHYAPDNAVVVVAGDVTPEEVRALVDKHYGAIPANGAIGARERPAEPPQIAERRVLMEDGRVGQPYLTRSYLAPSRRADDQSEAAALSVLSQILGGSGPNSTLSRALQFDRKIAVQSYAYYDPTGYDGSTFGIAVVPAPGVTLQQAETALDETLAAFLKDGVRQEDFDRVMAQLRAREIYALDSAMGVARRYGAALTSGLTVADQMNWPAELQKVTPAAVAAAAAKLFDRKQSVTGWLRQEANQ